MNQKLRLLTVLLCLMYSFTANAQDKTVTGTIVSNKDNLPLPGVSILIKGTSIGTVTNIDGIYKLDVPQDATTLVYSYIGFKSIEMEIGDQSTLDITLEEDAQQLSEVVVTAFGVEREAKALGYSTQQIGSEDLAENRQANVLNGLAGKVAGVQLSPGAGAGSGTNVVIRGMTSVNGNNQPLYVVDGVPLENSPDPFSGDGFGASDNAVFGGGISEISPDNIASISILKGPSAAALYGSRGANGVVLITTKDGSETNGFSVEVNSNVTWENPLVEPNFQNIYGGGNGYVSWYADGRNGGVTDPLAVSQFNAAYPGVNPQGTAGVDESWGAPMDGRLVRTWWSGEEVAPLVPVPDMWRNYWETGMTATNNVSLSAGGEKGSFRLSVGRMDQQGIYYNNDFTRNNIRLNSNYKFNNKFSAKVSAEYVKSGSDNRQQPILWDVYTWHHRHDDWGLLKDYQQFMDVHITRDDDEYGYANWQHSFARNRFHEQEVLFDSQDKDRFLGNVALNYEFTDWLSLMVRTGTDFWTDTRIDVYQDARTKNGVTRTEAYSEEVWRKQETNSDFIMTFDKTFNNAYSVVAQVGGVHRTNYTKRNYTNVQALVINGLYNVANNAIPNQDESDIIERETNSLFGSLQLGYKGFLFAEVTARNDWSSTLPDGENSYFYPSVSLSGVLTEAFDISGSFLTFAKLRASWAKVGNDADPYLTSQIYQPRNPWNGSTPTFAEDVLLANSSLRNEETTGIELGADLRFLNGRLGLDVTYYDQTSTDQIMQVEISKASGYDKKVINAGEINNQGVEVILSGTPVQLANGFSWDVAVNYSVNRNEVIELAEGLQTIVLQSRRGLSLEARVGQPYGSFYGTAYDRAPDGQIIYEDGIPQVADELQIIGNVVPDWIGGIQNTFSYKGFAVTALVDARMGGDIADESTSTGMQTGIYPVTALGREEGVIGAGVKNIGTAENPNFVPNDVVVPTKSLTRMMSVRSVNEGAIYDASFIKLRQLSVRYSLPSSFLSKFANGFIKKASIAFVGNNVAMLWKNHPHMDPEVNVRGGNIQGGLLYNSIPTQRSLGFNLNIGF